MLNHYESTLASMRRTISNETSEITMNSLPVARGSELKSRRASLPEMSSATNISKSTRAAKTVSPITVQEKLERQKKLSARPETKMRDEEAFRAKLEARARAADPDGQASTNFVPRATFEPTSTPEHKQKTAKIKNRKSDKRLSIDDSVAKPVERPERRDPKTKSKHETRKIVTLGEPEVLRASNRHPETPKDIQVHRIILKINFRY